MDASAAEWAEIADDDPGLWDQWEGPAIWDDSPAAGSDLDSPWLEAGDWGGGAPGPWLEDDGWVWEDTVAHECASPALAVLALVVAVAALVSLAVVVLQSRRRQKPAVVVTEVPLEFPLGLGLSGGDDVVPPPKREGGAA